MQLKTSLHGQTARSWQHADECVMRALATRLHRDPASVRRKAARSLVSARQWIIDSPGNSS